MIPTFVIAVAMVVPPGGGSGSDIEYAYAGATLKATVGNFTGTVSASMVLTSSSGSIITGPDGYEAEAKSSAPYSSFVAANTFAVSNIGSSSSFCSATVRSYGGHWGGGSANFNSSISSVSTVGGSSEDYSDEKDLVVLLNSGQSVTYSGSAGGVAGE